METAAQMAGAVPDVQAASGANDELGVPAVVTNGVTDDAEKFVWTALTDVDSTNSDQALTS